MRKCERTSKSATKDKRAHAEAYVQYEHPDAHTYTHILQKAPHLNEHSEQARAPHNQTDRGTCPGVGL
jgi:hypothetical protein